MSNNYIKQQELIYRMVAAHPDIHNHGDNGKNKIELADWMRELFADQPELLGVALYRKEWVVITEWNNGAQGKETVIQGVNIKNNELFGEIETVRKNEVTNIYWNKKQDSAEEEE